MNNGGLVATFSSDSLQPLVALKNVKHLRRHGQGDNKCDCEEEKQKWKMCQWQTRLPEQQTHLSVSQSVSQGQWVHWGGTQLTWSVDLFGAPLHVVG